MSRLSALAYRKAHHFLKFREDHDLIFTLIELTAAVIGTIAFTHELFEHGAAAMLDSELLEVALFVILLISLLARLFSMWRAHYRGPRFGEIFGFGAPKLSFDIDSLPALRPVQGTLGAALKGPATPAAITALAREAASTFSEKTYGEPDGYWEYWERAYLAQWHEALATVIWRIPVPDAAETAGYYSVALPIAAACYERIARGHLPTALAAIDHGPASEGEISILAYTAQYVPLAHEAGDPRLLLYCAVEHIAWLITQRAPGLFAGDGSRGVRIICESANRSLDTVLAALGFQLVLQGAGEGEDDGPGRAVQSPAGFRLHEFRLAAGADPQGQRLTRLLGQLSQMQPPVDPARAERDAQTNATASAIESSTRLGR